MVRLELFDLIQSMTMSEKRYFKVYSSKHVIGGKNDYVQLFDAIDKMSDYDEDALLSKKFVKNLSAEKNYLYKLVLKSLNAFHQGVNPKTKIYNLLQSIEVLYHKGLYSQAEKLCQKARKIAVENELFSHQLSINEILIELLSKQFKYAEVIDQLDSVKEVKSQMDNFEKIQYHTMHAYLEQWDKGYARTMSDQETLKGFIENKEVNSKKYPKSKRAELYRLGLNLTYAFFINDTKKMIALSLEMNALYEDNIHLITYSTIGYVSSLFNTANAYVKTNQFEKALEVIEKLEDCKDDYGIASSHNIGARIFFYCFLVRMDVYLKQDEFQACEAIMESTKSDFQRFEKFIGKPHLYESYFLMSKFYFVIGEYRNALKYSNFVINDNSFKVRKDLLSVVRLLNLLVHYELHNDFTLEYLNKNTFNYFKSKNRLYKVENELIKFISGRNKDANNVILKEDLIQLQEAMKSFKNDLHEKTPFNYFDFEYWAISKLTKKALKDF